MKRAADGMNETVASAPGVIVVMYPCAAGSDNRQSEIRI